MTSTPTVTPVAHAAYASGVDTIGRRRLLQLLAGTATAVGFGVLGVFRFAPKAGAYTEWESGQSSYCGNYDPDSWYGEPDDNGYWNVNGCQNGGCVGVQSWAMGRAYCTKCSEISETSLNQWHVEGKRGSATFGDRSNICNPTGAGSRDAWRWQQAGCGYCFPATWRCHDGFKRAADGTTITTICQGLVYCNGVPYTGCNQ